MHQQMAAVLDAVIESEGNFRPLRRRSPPSRAPVPVT